MLALNPVNLAILIGVICAVIVTLCVLSFVFGGEGESEYEDEDED